MGKKRLIGKRGLYGTTALLLLSGPAYAQTPANSAGTSIAADEDVTDILVTAQRRSERLEDVPMAITAVSADSLVSAGISRFQDLGQLAPGVSISRSGAFTQPSIRGVSPLLNGAGLEGNIAIYIDGFYQSDPMGSNGDLANIENVQILKGPQGTLYGRNATGGAILITTKEPSDVMTGRFSAGYGNLNDRQYSLYLSGPISDRISFSVAGYNHENDGYIRDIGTVGRPELNDSFNAAPFVSRSLRTKLKFEATDNLDFTLAYNYGKAEDPRGIVYVQSAQLPASFPIGQAATARDQASQNFRQRNPQSSEDLQLTVKLDTGFGQLSSYTGQSWKRGLLHFDFDGTKVDRSSGLARYPQRTFQQAVDFAFSPVSNLDVVVGGLYYRDRFQAIGSRSASVPAVTLQTYSVEQNTRAFAVYADATYGLTDRLFLSGGVRYSHETKGIFSVQSPGFSMTTPIERDFSAATPRVALRYEVGPRTNVYASYSQGFKSGTFNPSTYNNLAAVVPVEQERVESYEIGFKTARGGLRFDTSAFYYDYRDIQVSITVPVTTPGAPAGTVQTLLGNADAAEIYGAEGSVEATPTDGLNLRLGLAYLHARVKSFPNASATGLNPVTNLNISGQNQDWAGVRLTRAPSWSGNAAVNYEFAALGGAMQLGFNGYFSSKYITNNMSLYSPADRRQRFVSPGYVLLNGSVNWTAPDEKLTLTAWMNNVLDKRYEITYSAGAFGSYKQYAEPRTYGVKASYSF